jgi:hypothetical protein
LIENVLAKFGCIPDMNVLKKRIQVYYSCFYNGLKLGHPYVPCPNLQSSLSVLNLIASEPSSGFGLSLKVQNFSMTPNSQTSFFPQKELFSKISVLIVELGLGLVLVLEQKLMIDSNFEIILLDIV